MTAPQASFGVSSTGLAAASPTVPMSTTSSTHNMKRRRFPNPRWHSVGLRRQIPGYFLVSPENSLTVPTCGPPASPEVSDTPSGDENTLDPYLAILNAIVDVLDEIPTELLQAVAAEVQEPTTTAAEYVERWGARPDQAVRGAERSRQEGAAYRAHRLGAALMLDGLLIQSAGSGLAVDDATALVGWLMDEYDVQEMRPHPISAQERIRRAWDKSRRRITPVILARDGAWCRACRTTERLTIDHIKPIDKGGNNAPENLQVLCGPCNSSKGARYEVEA